MAETPSREVLAKVRKLALLPEEMKQSQWSVPVTRLTILKSLCQDPGVAHRFVTYLAGKTLERVRQGEGRSSPPSSEKEAPHQDLMVEAMAKMNAWREGKEDGLQDQLWDLLRRMRDEQNEFRRLRGAAVRMIEDWNLLIFESALGCLLHSAEEAPFAAYQTASHYVGRHGSDLTAAAAPLVQDVADFWLRELGLDLETLLAPPAKKQAKATTAATPGSKKKAPGKKAKAGKIQFTDRQGQYLAFIYLYRKLHRQGPAETDLVRFFRVTPPAAHLMLVKLDELGLITREPGVARSARVAIPEAELPPLEDVEGPIW